MNAEERCIAAFVLWMLGFSLWAIAIVVAVGYFVDRQRS